MKLSDRIEGAGEKPIPSADGINWQRKTVAVWEEWRFGKWRAYKNNFDGLWQLSDGKDVVCTARSLSEVMAFANVRAREGG